MNGWTVAALALGTWALVLVPVWLRWRIRQRRVTSVETPLARPQHRAVNAPPQQSWHAEISSGHVPFDGAVTFGATPEQTEITRETP